MSKPSDGDLPFGFLFPEPAFAGLDAAATAALTAAAVDIAIIVDDEGRITNLAVNQPGLRSGGQDHWVGRLLTETVTVESHPKIIELLEEAQENRLGRGRQVNHPIPDGEDVPVLYQAMRLNAEGVVLAVGRDLTAMAALQRALMDAQRGMERDYSKLREIEGRYRQLFHLTREAVLIADVRNQQIQEANPAAADLFGKETRRLIGRSLTSAIGPADREPLERLLTSALASGAAERTIELKSGGTVLAGASVFRENGASHYLIRLAGGAAEVGPHSAGPDNVPISRLMEETPEVFVVAGADGKILSCNEAFLAHAQIGSMELALGENLERWLTRPGTGFSDLLTSLRDNGPVSALPMMLLGSYGTLSRVIVSAVATQHEAQSVIGLLIRPEAVQGEVLENGASPLPHSVTQLTDLVGQVPLKELVKETTDVIERLCIEAALDLTRNNRASAADLLGLSRQSLYVKLRRFGLGTGPEDSETP